MSGPGETVPAAGLEATPRPSRLTARIGSAAVLLYAAFLFGSFQLGEAGLIERDGYFHARFAQMLPQQGFSREFPWTQFSTWKDRFCDKEFLFHALMAPFARDAAEPLNGVRWFIWLLSLTALGVLCWMLDRHGVPLAPAFLFLTLCMTGLFLNRVTMIRSHVLSMVLLLLGLHFLLRSNWKALLALGFVYSWSYTIPLVLVLTAIPFATGKWLARGGVDWKPVAACSVGVVLGLVVHPYTPHTLETFFTYLDVVSSGVAGAKTSVELGHEIYSFFAPDFLRAFPLLAAGFIALCVVPWWGRWKLFGVTCGVAGLWALMLAANSRMSSKDFLLYHAYINLALPALGVWGWRSSTRLSADSVGVACSAIFWFFMTMAMSRFSEYAVPVMMLACALSARDLLKGVDLRDLFLKEKSVAAWCGALLFAAALGAGHWHARDYYLTVTKQEDPARFKLAAEWMAQNLEPNETVVNLLWDDFPELYYHGHRQRYLVGLDPTYMQRFDAEKLDLLEGMRRKKRPLNGALLAQAFGARYMILRRLVTPNRIDVRRIFPEFDHEKWKPVYADGHAYIFALTGPHGYAPPIVENP